MKAARGFTLIELLVVIAIIGVLSSVVLASLNTAREKARNAKRVSDLHQVQTALELYASDHGGTYPNVNGWIGTTPSCYSNPGTPNGAIPGLAPTYIPAVPEDPKPTLPYYCYLYLSNGTDYKVLAYGTVEGGAVANGAANARYPLSCGPGSESSYAVYTAGAACW